MASTQHDVRTNIKIKKERKINLLTPTTLLGDRATEEEEGEERRGGGVRRCREGLELLVASSHWASSSTSCSASLFCSSPGEKTAGSECLFRNELYLQPTRCVCGGAGTPEVGGASAAPSPRGYRNRPSLPPLTDNETSAGGSTAGIFSLFPPRYRN